MNYHENGSLCTPVTEFNAFSNQEKKVLMTLTLESDAIHSETLIRFDGFSVKEVRRFHVFVSDSKNNIQRQC